MKRVSVLLLAMLVCAFMQAYDVVVDGIAYNLTSKIKTAEVTSGDSPYEGEIVIPSTINAKGATYKVVAVGEGAFMECQGLTKVTISENVESLELRAFYFCQNLTDVVLPNSLKYIKSHVFHGCISLSNINLPNQLESIGSYAFCYCALTSVVIPESITILNGGRSFNECTKLTSVTLPKNMTVLGYEFVGCTSLEKLELPPNLEHFGGVYDCTALTELIYPNSCYYSGINQGCTSLKKVVLGTGMTEMAQNAFKRCKDLEDVYCYATEVPFCIQTTFFDDALIEYATLHVPDEAINKYAAAEPWKNFGKIVGINGTELTKCENPVISYSDGKLLVTCGTEGANCITTVTDTSIKTYYDNEIPLTLTYTVTAYATATGHRDSDVVTATLCWVNSTPETEGLSLDIKEHVGNAVLIQNQGQILTVSGLEDGTPVSVYSTDGHLVGSSKSHGSQVSIDTNLEKGSVVIVKFGEKAGKIVLH